MWERKIGPDFTFFKGRYHLLLLLCFCRCQKCPRIACHWSRRGNRVLRKMVEVFWFPIYFHSLHPIFSMLLQRGFFWRILRDTCTVPLFSLNPFLDMNTTAVISGISNTIVEKSTIDTETKEKLSVSRKKTRFAAYLKGRNNRSSQNTPFSVICKPCLGLCFKHCW